MSCHVESSLSLYSRGSLCGWRIGGKEGIACWATMWHAAKWRVVVVAIEVLAIGIVALRKYVPGIVEDGRDGGELLPGLVDQQGGCLVAPFAYEALDEVSARGQRQCCWDDEMMRDARDCQSRLPALRSHGNRLRKCLLFHALVDIAQLVVCLCNAQADR